MSAVSCELLKTSAACCSGESSSPKDAWIPPWALAELHACSVLLVAIATRAPARSAETAAASPEAPLPITSTSKNGEPATAALYHRSTNRNHNVLLFERAPAEGLDTLPRPWRRSQR